MLVNKNEVIKTIKDFGKQIIDRKTEFDIVDDFVELINRVEKVPKADYVEVVFCKDCKHWERLYYRPFVEPRNDGRCKALWQFHDAERNITFEDHFCSYGERKESEVQGG